MNLQIPGTYVELSLSLRFKITKKDQTSTQMSDLLHVYTSC